MLTVYSPLDRDEADAVSHNQSRVAVQWQYIGTNLETLSPNEYADIATFMEVM
jgi:hypothetical protein